MKVSGLRRGHKRRRRCDCFAAEMERRGLGRIMMQVLYNKITYLSL